MNRNWAAYIILITLGIFLASSSYIGTISKKDVVETEQSDSQSNDSDERESKRSFDDEVFLYTYFKVASHSHETTTFQEHITEELPHICLSLHCPPPEIA